MAIIYKIGFEAETSRISDALGSIQRDIQKAFSNPQLYRGLSQELKEGVRQAQILESALKKATSDKGISFVRLNTELKQAGSSIDKMITGLSSAGMTDSMNTFLNSLVQADRGMLTLSKRAQEFGRVMTQSFKFSMAQEGLQALRNGLSEAITYVKELDSAMNSIQIVTGKTGAEMERVTQNTVESARQLRVSAKDYADASLIFYQQGLGDAEVKRRSDTTIMAARAAGESVSQMSQELTAVWNTYQMEGEQLERAASIGAKLGAETAVDFKYIAEAMGIAATSAAQLGTSYESLSSIIATVGSVTQQSASVVGTAYRTIFTRLSNLKLDGETEDGVKLGQITKQLAEVGVNALDANGELRKTDELIMELGTHWGEYSQAQQAAIAQVVGGTRQFGQFLALMQNFDTYLQNMQSAMSETGSETLVQQYETSLDTIESKATNAAEAWKRAFAQIFTTESLKGFYEIIEGAGNLVEDIIAGFGGLQGVIAVIGRLISSQIVDKMFEAGRALKTMWDTRTPEQATQYMSKILENAKEQTAKAYLNTFQQQTPDKPGYAQYRADYEMSFDAKKIELTQQASAATAQLNDQIAHGDALLRAQAQAQLTIIQNAHQRAIAELDVVRALEDQLSVAQQDAFDLSMSGSAGNKSMQSSMRKMISLFTELSKTSRSETGKVTKDLENLSKTWVQGTGKKGSNKNGIVQQLQNASKEIKTTDKNLGTLVDKAAINFEQLGTKIKEGVSVKDIVPDIQRAASSISMVYNEAKKSNNTQIINTSGLADASNMLKQLAASMGLVIDAEGKMQVAAGANPLAKYQMDAMGVAQTFSSLLMSINMMVAAFQGLSAAVQDGSLSFGEFLGAAGMIVPAVVDITRQIIALGSAMLAETVIKTSATGATIAYTTAENAGIVAKTAATIANWALNASLSPLLVITLAITAAIVALVAVIWLIVKAFQAWQANTPEGKLKSTREEIARLREEASKAREAVKDLSSSFDSFNSAREQLKQCTRGTVEWTEQMIALNGQLDDLITKFPMLEDYVRFDENGIPYISEEGYKKTLDTYAGGIKANQEATRREERQEATLETSVAQKNFRNAFFDWGSSAQGILEEIIKNNAGASAEYILSEFNKTGVSAGAKEEAANTKNEIQAYSKALAAENMKQTKSFVETGVATLSESGAYQKMEAEAQSMAAEIAGKAIDAAITERRSQIGDYETGWEDYLVNTVSNAAGWGSAGMIAGAAIGGTGGSIVPVAGTAIGGGAGAAVGGLIGVIGGAIKGIADTAIQDIWGDKNNPELQNLFQEWLTTDNAQKYKNAELADVSDEGITINYEGSEEPLKISFDEIATDLVMTKNATEIAEKAVNDFTVSLGNLNKNIADTGNQLAQTTDETEKQGLTEKLDQLQSLKGFLLDDNITNKSLKDISVLQSALADGDISGLISDEDLQNLGYSSGAELKAAFESALGSSEWGPIIEDLKENLNLGDDLSSVENLDFSSAQKLVDIYTEIKDLKAQASDTTKDEAEKQAIEEKAIALENYVNKLTQVSQETGDNGTQLNRILSAQQYLGTEQSMKLLGDDALTDLDTLTKYADKLENVISLREKWKNAKSMIGADGIVDEDQAEALNTTTEDFENYVESLMAVQKANKNIAEDQRLSKEEMAEYAEETLETAAALEELEDVWEKYGKTLKKGIKQGESSQEEMEDFYYAVEQVKDSLGEVLKIDPELLSDSFWESEEAMSALEGAINGSEEGLEQLRLYAADDIVMTVTMGDTQAYNELTSLLDTARAAVAQANIDGSMVITPSADLTGAIQNIWNFMAQAGATFDQFQDMAAAALGIHVDVEGTQVNATDTQDIPTGFTTTVDSISGNLKSYTGNPEDGFTEVNIPTSYDQVTYSAQGPETEELQKSTMAFNSKVSNGKGVPLSNIKPSTFSFKKIDAGGGGVNRARARNPGSGGSKPKGGGGGGGGGPKFKAKEKRDPRDQAEDLKEKEDMEEFVERYENIDRALEDNAAALEKAGDAGDRLFGKGRAQALMEQNKLLEEQNELLDWQIKDAEKYVQWDRDKLMTEFGIPKELLETNEDGSLKYREQIMQILEDRQEQQRQEYNDAMAQIHLSENQLVDQYNAAGDASEEADKAYEDASKELEYQKKALDDKWEGQQQNIQDTIDTLDEFEEAGARVFDGTQQKLANLREMWDNAFEARELVIEVQLEINERDIDFYEYIREGLGEDLENAALRTQYFKLEANELATSWDQVRESANNAMWDLQNADPAADNTKLWDAFDTAFDNMMDYGERLRDVREEYKEEYINALEDLRDRWDNLNGEVERQQDLISGMNDLLRETGLIYNDNEDSIRIMDNYVESMTTSLKLSSEEYQNALAREQELQEQLATWEKTGNKAMIDDIKEELAVAQEWRQEAQLGMIEAGAALASAVTEAMEHFRDVGEEAWMDQVSTMFNSFEDGAELLDQKLDLENYYMHENDKAFAIEEMIWQIEDAIEATSDPGQLDKYQELLDDLNAKKTDGKKVTEDEMAIYKAQLDLMLEQSRLEDARNAKNSMRLARDASGNWSYVYSQDTSETEDLERSIAEKQHNIDKMWRDYEQSREQEYYQILQDMHDFQQSKNDQLYATDENYRNWYDSRYNMYKEQLNNSANEINKALDHTGNDFKETALGYVLDMDNMDEANKKYQGEIDKWEEACSDKYKDYSKTAEDAFESVGWDMEDLAGTMADESDKIIGEMDNVQGKVDELKDTTETAFKELISSQNAFRRNWVENMQQVCDSIDAYLERMQKFNQSMKEDSNDFSNDFTQDAFDRIIADAPEDYRYDPNGSRPLDGSIARILSNRQMKLDAMSEEERAKYATNEEVERVLMQLSPSDLKWLSDLNKAATQSESEMYQKYLVSEGGEGTYPTFDPYIDDFAAGMELLIERGLKGTFLYNQLRVGRQKKINVLALNNPDEYGAWYDWEDPNGFYNKYAKGGYTGNGSLSKGDHIPALLSSQEYVLNPEDTKNILHAVKVTRDIVQARVNGVLSNLAAQYLNITPQTGTQQNELKQKVKIEANFPNVQNRTEIEAAFDNLINKAAQYVLKDE